MAGDPRTDSRQRNPDRRLADVGGRPSSVAQRVIERLDAMISETDDEGRPVVYNRVAGVVNTGNEDGDGRQPVRRRDGVAKDVDGTAARVGRVTGCGSEC